MLSVLEQRFHLPSLRESYLRGVEGKGPLLEGESSQLIGTERLILPHEFAVLEHFDFYGLLETIKGGSPQGGLPVRLT